MKKAATIGTEKVISDHATIGVVITSDGTFGELDREAFVEAERRTVEKLRAIGKPYVMIINSGHPTARRPKTSRRSGSGIPVQCASYELSADGQKDFEELFVACLI